MSRRGFTLIELLIVILIILLVSAATIPAIVSFSKGNQVGEGVRIIQAALAGARDAALHYNEPRGIRLLPDPTLTRPSIALANAGVTNLAYNRVIPIEQGPDYRSGMVGLNPAILNSASPIVPWPKYLDNGPSPGSDPYMNVRVDQEAFTLTGSGMSWSAVPYEPTNWYWNVKVGDQIRFNGSGRWWTIVGPVFINPFDNAGQNPELFVNAGPPGDTTHLITKAYIDPNGKTQATGQLEYLFVVDGLDNNGDGYSDNSWDGFDNNYNGLVDDWLEGVVVTNPGPPVQYGPIESEPISIPSVANVGTASPPNTPNYTIKRRNPVLTQGGREVMLPANVVIDASTGSPLLANPTFERSRLPVDPFSLYVDILLDPGGRVIPTTRYSSPTSFSMFSSFYHFWVTEREGVVEPVFGVNAAGQPLPNCNAAGGFSFVLPMPKGAAGYFDNCSSTPPTHFLQGERKLLTLYARTGNVAVNSLESETSFNANYVNAPFWPAQQGFNESK